MMPHADLPHYKTIPLESLYHFALLFYNENDLDHTTENLKMRRREFCKSIEHLEDSIDVELIERNPRTGRIDWSGPISYTHTGQILLARTAPFMCGLFELEHKLRVSQHASKYVSLAKTH